MNESTRLSPRDLEDLSVYLDGALPPSRAARLEERLKSEPSLREALEDLRRTITLVKSLPEVPVPRDFTLTPAMVGIREPRRPYPVLRLATVLAALALVSVVGLDALFNVAGVPMAALAPQPGAQLEVDIEPEVAAEEREESMLAAVAQETPELTEKIMAAPEEPRLAAEMGTPQAEAFLGDNMGGGIPETPCEGCPEVMGTATPELTDAVVEPTETATEMPTMTPEPAEFAGARVARGHLSGWRMAEIGLGAVVLVLGAITLWSRRKAA